MIDTALFFDLCDIKKTLALLCLIFSNIAPCNTDNIGIKVDTSVRLGVQSEKKPRWQYRLRLYPQLMLSQELSLNAFVNTGNSFASSYNTLDNGAADYLYVRRLYLRHQQGRGKTEFGIIPTYKGPVSSTGLSKDGLTEDFLDTGHALSFELQGRLPENNPLTWFVQLEHYQRSDTSRVQLGLQYKFSRG